MSRRLSPGRRLFYPVALLLLVVVVPQANAAPMEGGLSFSEHLLLEGQTTWQAEGGAMDLYAPKGAPAYTLRLDAAEARVHEHSWSERHADARLVAYDGRGEMTTKTTAFGAIDGRIEALRAGAHLVLHGDGMTTRAETRSAVLTASQGVWFSSMPGEALQGPMDDPAYHSFSYRAADMVTAAADDMTATLAGDLTLTLYEGDLTLQTAEGAATFSSGADPEARITIGDQATTADHRLVELELTDARVVLEWGATAHLAGATPAVAVTGTVTAPQARGALTYYDASFHARDEPVAITGSLTLTPAVETDRTTLPYSIYDPMRHYDGGGATVSGDADAVIVSSVPAVDPFQGDDDLLARAATGLGILAVAFALWRWAPLGLAALYSRIEQNDLLAHELRAEIYEIVRRNPGIHARRIHREVEASWGTVMHHLSKLEGGGLVATRMHGTSKCYYENHGKWDGRKREIAVLTREKTRQVADAVRAVPGRDQNQIIARTGMPQSTISYHLRKLEDAGLVDVETISGSRCYYPTRLLRELLQVLDGGDLPHAETPALGGVPS